MPATAMPKKDQKPEARCEALAARLNVQAEAGAAGTTDAEEEPTSDSDPRSDSSPEDRSSLASSPASSDSDPAPPAWKRGLVPKRARSSSSASDASASPVPPRKAVPRRSLGEVSANRAPPAKRACAPRKKRGLYKCRKCKQPGHKQAERPAALPSRPRPRGSIDSETDGPSTSD